VPILSAMDDLTLLRFLRDSAADLFIVASRAGSAGTELARIAGGIEDEADELERLLQARRAPESSVPAQ